MDIRLLLVDDHAVMRQGLRFLLERCDRLRVVGEASSAQEAMGAALRLRPHIILLDLILPDMNIGAICTELRRLCPDTRILILSGTSETHHVFEAVDAGIDGYALKNMDTADLITAIEQVAAGQSYLHPTITRTLLHRTARAHRRPSAVDGAAVNLTPRQKQVLMLMTSTSTNREIAERLNVTEETVRSHVKMILRKFDKPTRTQAVLEAVRLGIIRLQEM